MSRDARSPEGRPDDEEAFVSRWSRLKQEEPSSAASAPTGEADLPEAPPLTDADMPPLETLDEASDYSGFMSPGVSEPLRNMALRRLFAGSEFNLRDGLDDYDDNFTDFAKLAGIVTADMRHRLAQRAEAESRKQQEDEEEPPAEQALDATPGQGAQTDAAQATAGASTETGQEETTDANPD